MEYRHNIQCQVISIYFAEDLGDPILKNSKRQLKPTPQYQRLLQAVKTGKIVAA
jgi:uncharacterized protein YeaC (DUF1315 family)